MPTSWENSGASRHRLFAALVRVLLAGVARDLFPDKDAQFVHSTSFGSVSRQSAQVHRARALKLGARKAGARNIDNSKVILFEINYYTY